MKKIYLAAGLALAGIIGACSSDSVTTPSIADRALSPRLAGGVSGAFNTTDVGCVSTNINQYATKQDVYLSGSPATSNLPEGNYYVRVQTPNGIDLGTTATATYVVAEGLRCIQLWSLIEFGTTTNPGGEYRVLIDADGDFRNAKNDNFKILADEPVVASSLVSVIKFYDANGDGIRNNGEVAIEGWKVNVAPFIDADFDVFTSYSAELANGFYTFTEYDVVGGTWINTTGKVVERTIGIDSPDIEFGNFCLVAGGGKTLGFWSNKNGERLMGDNGGVQPELDLLNALPLANAAGPQANFTSYTNFRTWLLGGTATNMAYMLSVQLAAMKLNVESGGVSGSSLVYAPNVEASNASGFITIDALMVAAVNALADQNTLAGDPNRAEQEDIKNALDAANNNTNFVSPTPCSINGVTWSLPVA